MTHLNPEVSRFLDDLDHPFRNEIELLRECILNAKDLQENIKWNAPNYTFDSQDRITMKIQPPKMIQLIFHCGAKVQQEPSEKLVKEDFGLLQWKTNDRAIATFKNRADIELHQAQISQIVVEWINNSKL